MLVAHTRIAHSAGDDLKKVLKMKKRRFDQLVKGVREMKRHMAGKPLREARVTELAQPDVGAIREASVARSLDEVVASLPAVRRSKVERRARELKSSAKPSQRARKKRAAKGDSG